jgi:hypothetical protein
MQESALRELPERVSVVSCLPEEIPTNGISRQLVVWHEVNTKTALPAPVLLARKEISRYSSLARMR